MLKARLEALLAGDRVQHQGLGELVGLEGHDSAAGLDDAAHLGDGALDVDGVFERFGGVGTIERRGAEGQRGAACRARRRRVDAGAQGA